jgi:hypothetical protein|tara:strand:- start:305 stop:820 length:516 start_codon:yes stop_codon:yes gene_type:complete
MCDATAYNKVILITETYMSLADHVKYIRRRNNDGFRLKYALNHTERRLLVREVNIYALVLFEYYLRVASTDNTPISDAAAAEYFGWTETTAQRHRLALSRAGWFAREKLTLKGGRRMHMTYLGKDEVWESGLAPKGLERPTKKVKPRDSLKVETPKTSLFKLPDETKEKEI